MQRTVQVDADTVFLLSHHHEKEDVADTVVLLSHHEEVDAGFIHSLGGKIQGLFKDFQ